jgi:hypothetical protein
MTGKWKWWGDYMIGFFIALGIGLVLTVAFLIGYDMGHRDAKWEELEKLHEKRFGKD